VANFWFLNAREKKIAVKRANFLVLKVNCLIKNHEQTLGYLKKMPLQRQIFIDLFVNSQLSTVNFQLKN